MRLFIAAQTGAGFKNALLALQKKMKQSGVTGNYTPEQNLHLTLAFIGEYGDPDAVLKAIKESAPVRSEVTLDGMGSFGDLYFARLSASDELYKTVSRLRSALGARGIPFDKKKFTPHITLIRRAQGVTRLPQTERVCHTIEKITLFRSDRTERGMVYTALGSCGCVSADGKAYRDNC